MEFQAWQRKWLRLARSLQRKVRGLVRGGMKFVESETYKRGDIWKEETWYKYVFT